MYRVVGHGWPMIAFYECSSRTIFYERVRAKCRVSKFLYRPLENAVMPFVSSMSIIIIGPP